MGIDISRLEKTECSAEVETTIGKLSMFYLSLKHSYIISKALRQGVDENKPLQCIKILITLICYPQDSLKNGKYKPEERVLGLKDVDKLTEKEIENIAEIYIANNRSLYKKKKSWIEINNKGEEIHHSKYEGVKYPREESESSISYLYRLLCLADERYEKQMRDIMSSIPKLGGFSPNLQKTVAGNLLAGNVISEAIKSIEPLQKSVQSIPVQKNYEFNDDVIKMHDSRVKASREPFDRLAERLDTLIDASSKSTEILAEGNVQQVEMYSENKSVIDKTNRALEDFIEETKRNSVISNRYAIANLLSAGIVIFLTIYGLFFK